VAGASASSSVDRHGITDRDTLAGVTQAISVRLDEEAERALRSLEAAGLSRSEAIRSALIDSARRLQQRSELAAEVVALEADDADRREMLAVASLMESLRAPG
jgi:Arc/MetJ-type ribon-helix-helix transcriptional regulator